MGLIRAFLPLLEKNPAGIWRRSDNYSWENRLLTARQILFCCPIKQQILWLQTLDPIVELLRIFTKVYLYINLLTLDNFPLIWTHLFAWQPGIFSQVS